MTIRKGMPAFAGYSEEGSPLYVGPCCKAQISELASHIYWWWEVDKRVPQGTKLWRYMDLSKLLSMFEGGTLFFPRADTLADPFEGASGIAEREAEWDRHYLAEFREALRNVPSGYPSREEDIERSAAGLLRQIKQQALNERQSTFVSCWHSSWDESEALWRLYCPPGSAGVLIETTVDRLSASLDDADIEIGAVQYVDYRKSFAGVHDRIFWKRNTLKHEAEVRAVFRQEFSDQCTGVHRLVNLETLIESVIPSPFGPDWLGHLLEQISKRYGLPLEVKTSEILAQPFF